MPYLDSSCVSMSFRRYHGSCFRVHVSARALESHGDVLQWHVLGDLIRGLAETPRFGSAPFALNDETSSCGTSCGFNE